MPSYFLDTSALAKLYHKECGSDYIDRVLEERGSRSLISHLSIVEMESVLAVKMRTGEIDEPAIEIARRRFRSDLAQQRLIVAPPVLEHHFHSARKLLVQYGASEGSGPWMPCSSPSLLICGASGKSLCSLLRTRSSVE